VELIMAAEQADEEIARRKREDALIARYGQPS